MASPRPSYLLTDIPDVLRTALSAAAADQDSSIQDVILRALYEHYGLEFPKRRGRRYVSWMDRGSSRLVIRATPELFDAIKEAAADKTMRQVILDVLADEYLVGLGS